MFILFVFTTIMCHEVLASQIRVPEWQVLIWIWVLSSAFSSMSWGYFYSENGKKNHVQKASWLCIHHISLSASIILECLKGQTYTSWRALQENSGGQQFRSWVLVLPWWGSTTLQGLTQHLKPKNIAYVWYLCQNAIHWLYVFLLLPADVYFWHALYCCLGWHAFVLYHFLWRYTYGIFRLWRSLFWGASLSRDR